MTHSTRALLGVTAFALASCTTLAAFAQTPSAPKTGYLTDSQNGHVMAGNAVDCWRTSDWTPALALEPCDAVIKKVVVAQMEPAPEAAPAAAPPPAPTPIAVAPSPPLPSRINFSADALFGFDKSVIGPDGRKMLDDLSVQLKTVTVDAIQVTGHTDRFGSSAYNQKLSERRAQAVREYMVAGGVADTKIDAKGMGETQPVTKPEDCKGKQSAKVIACLQADRRVDVELQGTQAAKP